MPKVAMEIVADLEGGERIQVVADQRDFAKFEVQEFGCSFGEIEGRMFTAMRYVSWAAARRQQMTALSWLQWDAKCVEAMPVEDEESELPADAGDPGQPGQPG